MYYIFNIFHNFSFTAIRLQRTRLIIFVLLFAFKNISTQNNCLEISDPLCINDPASCVDKQVRSRISSLLSREDFFFEDNIKDILPYGCYLTPEPTVPYHSDCEKCSQMCDRTREREQKWEEMCQIYCWEERVRCTTATIRTTTTPSSTVTKTTNSFPSQESLTISSKTSLTIEPIDKTIRESTNKLTNSMFLIILYQMLIAIAIILIISLGCLVLIFLYNHIFLKQE